MPGEAECETGSPMTAKRDTGTDCIASGTRPRAAPGPPGVVPDVRWDGAARGAPGSPWGLIISFGDGSVDPKILDGRSSGPHVPGRRRNDHGELLEDAVRAEARSRLLGDAAPDRRDAVIS